MRCDKRGSCEPPMNLQMFWKFTDSKYMAKASVPEQSAPATNSAVAVPRALKAAQDMAKRSLEHNFLHRVPTRIADHPIWLRVRRLAKDVRVLVHNDTVTVLLVQLAGSEMQLVVKGYPAFAAKERKRQIAAEVEAARQFSGHPLMATLLASGYDKHGNWCGVTPYAGCCLSKIIRPSRWFGTTTLSDRLQFARAMLAYTLTVFAHMQAEPIGQLYRDIKPENTSFNPRTGQVCILDFGCLTRLDKSDFHPCGTAGYYAPELAARLESDPNWDDVDIEDKLAAATGPSLCTFVSSYMALEAVVPLPSEWRFNHHLSDTNWYHSLMKAHVDADYDSVIRQATVDDPLACEYFKLAMSKDPQQRPTPAEALQHPWLAHTAGAVQQSIMAVASEYQRRNALVVKQLSKAMRKVTGGFLAKQQQPVLQLLQPVVVSSINSSSSSVESPRTPNHCSSIESTAGSNCDIDKDMTHDGIVIVAASRACEDGTELKLCTIPSLAAGINASSADDTAAPDAGSNDSGVCVDLSSGDRDADSSTGSAPTWQNEGPTSVMSPDVTLTAVYRKPTMLQRILAACGSRRSSGTCTAKGASQGSGCGQQQSSAVQQKPQPSNLRRMTRPDEDYTASGCGLCGLWGSPRVMKQANMALNSSSR